MVVSATKWTAEATGVELRTTRSSWRSPLGSGWPESTAASSAAAAGVRSCTGTGLELEVERSEALGMLYGVLRTRWTRRGDQMVTGAASTASSATAEVRPWWGGGYGEGTRGRRGGNGGVAHRGCSGRRSGLGDALETANRRRRWSEPEEGNGDVAAMQGFRRGLAWWGGRGSRGGASELLGGARGGRRRWLRRTAATVCFGRERERAREKRGRVSESRGDRDGLRTSSTRPGGRRQAGGGRAAARARARSSFGAWGGRRRGATVLGWVDCWLGRPAGWAAQVSLSPFFSVFCFI